MKKLFALLFPIVLINSACTQSEKKEEIKNDTPKQEVTSANKEESNVEKKIVARINGEPIFEEDLQGKPIRRVITEEILYQEGLKRGLDKQFQRDVRNYQKILIVDSMNKELLANTPKEEVSDEQIERHYKKHQDSYTFLSLKEISVGDKNTAEEIRRKLLAGEDPQKIQSEFGDKLAIKDLMFGKKYHDLFDKKEAGSVSEVIEEETQFKIFLIRDVRNIPLNRVKNAIKHNIMAIRRGRAMQEKVEELKKENNIQVEILVEEQKEEKMDEAE